MGVRAYLPRNSRIPCVIASEAKQSLEILNLLGNSRICLGILDFYLKFPTMSSSGLTRGSLYGIFEFFMMRSPEQVGGGHKTEGVSESMVCVSAL